MWRYNIKLYAIHRKRGTYQIIETDGDFAWVFQKIEKFLGTQLQ